jgi:hypothetical protein
MAKYLRTNTIEAKTTFTLSVQEDKRALFNAVREHPGFAESWRESVLNDWQAFDDHDLDSGGACNFKVNSMIEFRELIAVLTKARIHSWHLWVTIEADAIHASGGLGFRSDGDVTGSIGVDWNKLDDKTQLKVKQVISILEGILEA